jgi:hypothetical protein
LLSLCVFKYPLITIVGEISPIAVAIPESTAAPGLTVGSMDELYPTKAAEFRVALIFDALKARYQQRHSETGLTKALPWDDAEQYAVQLHQQVAELVGDRGLTRRYPGSKG